MYYKRWTLFVCACALLAGSAAAQSRDENLARCEGNDPDLEISGCTALIQPGQETTENLATAFFNRGNAYDNKGQHDRAVQDFHQAIRLNPTDAVAIS